jgi:hypothetical protein
MLIAAEVRKREHALLSMFSRFCRAPLSVSFPARGCHAVTEHTDAKLFLEKNKIGPTMKRVLISFVYLFLLLIIGCATVSPKREGLAFVFSGYWDVKHPYVFEAPGKYKIMEWVPRGQKVDDWSDLLTQQNFSKRAMLDTPAELMNNLKMQMEKDCANVKWNVLQQTPTSILYEWRIRDCPPLSDQHEIARIIDGQWNRWRIAYTSKVIEIQSDKRTEWIESLTSAHVRAEP